MSEPGNTGSRYIRFAPLLVIILVALVYLLNTTDSHAWGDDFSLYLMHARNIADGTPYAQTGYLYNVDTAVFGPKAYPPVFPAMLAPVIALWGMNFIALKLVGLICFVVLLYLVNQYLLPKTIQPFYRVLFLLMTGLFPFFFLQADNILSDIPFALFCVISLIRIDHHTHLSNRPGSHWTDSCLTGFLIYLAYGTRALGVTLIPVVFILDWIRNKRITLSTLTILGTAVLLAAIQALLIPETGNYLDQLPKSSNEAFMLLANSSVYYILTFTTLFQFERFSIQVIFFSLVLSLVLTGILVRIKKQVTAIDLFFLFYTAFLFAWPSNQGVRLLLPIIPIYFLYCVVGLQHLTSLPTTPAWITRIPLILLLAGLVTSYSLSYSTLVPRPPGEIGQREVQDLFAFVRTQTQQGDVIAFFKPRALALFTDRKSVAVAVPAPGGNTFDRMHELGVNYVIVRLDYELEYQPEILGLVRKNPDYFLPVYHNSGFVVYRFVYDNQLE